MCFVLPVLRLGLAFGAWKEMGMLTGMCTEKRLSDVSLEK